MLICFMSATVLDWVPNLVPIFISQTIDNAAIKLGNYYGLQLLQIGWPLSSKPNASKLMTAVFLFKNTGHTLQLVLSTHQFDMNITMHWLIIPHCIQWKLFMVTFKHQRKGSINFSSTVWRYVYLHLSSDLTNQNFLKHHTCFISEYAKRLC